MIIKKQRRCDGRVVLNVSGKDGFSFSIYRNKESKDYDILFFDNGDNDRTWRINNVSLKLAFEYIERFYIFYDDEDGLPRIFKPFI